MRSPIVPCQLAPMRVRLIETVSGPMAVARAASKVAFLRTGALEDSPAPFAGPAVAGPALPPDSEGITNSSAMDPVVAGETGSSSQATTSPTAARNKDAVSGSLMIITCSEG